MNGFYVSITNNLLEPKHVEKMGSAVWLFMYFIDKMTDISEGQGIVNHGNPVTYDMVKERLGISNRTYQRMLLILREAGYINTLQAKYGVYVTVNKAKKQFGKKATKKTKSSPAKNGTAKVQLRQKRISAMPNVADSYDKNGTALYIDNNTNTINNNNTTNVVEAKASYGKPEINEMFEFWEQTVGFPISSQIQKNRNACNNLIKRQGIDNLKRFIVWANMAHGDKYANKYQKIADFTELQTNLKHLVLWAKGKAVQENESLPRF